MRRPRFVRGWRGCRPTCRWSVDRAAAMRRPCCAPRGRRSARQCGDAATVRAFAQSCGQQAKTDRLDCVLLSQFGAVRRPGATPHPTRAPADPRVAARTGAWRCSCSSRTTASTCRKSRHSSGPPTHGSAPVPNRSRRSLSKSRRWLEADPTAKRDAIVRLRQVKGAGKIIAWSVWADLPNWDGSSPANPPNSAV